MPETPDHTSHPTPIRDSHPPNDPGTPLPRTEAQRAASRANGRKSQGPVTAMGKTNSAAAGITHGLTISQPVLQTESLAEYTRFRDTLISELQPTNNTEHFLVERMVNAQWRIRRAIREETALLDLEIDRTREEFDQVITHSDDDTRTAYATESLCAYPALNHITRHESRLVAQFDRALKALERLRNPKHQRPTTTATQSKNNVDPEQLTENTPLSILPACPDPEPHTPLIELPTSTETAQPHPLSEQLTLPHALPGPVNRPSHSETETTPSDEPAQITSLPRTENTSLSPPTGTFPTPGTDFSSQALHLLIEELHNHPQARPVATAILKRLTGREDKAA